MKKAKKNWKKGKYLIGFQSYCAAHLVNHNHFDLDTGVQLLEISEKGKK